ncbi:hypothetical protein M409DRAFT_27813 [Zasmidium cellare ATCC 36951]|uniref:Uncharacterized protein n=1 Tax=Zasmidium cellare ATCC 36951 TaxID=1080233 RepID=A0A6A6C3N5_ZASCE|nr:uncharacterized protein M409DRAFT_27813 [Zasmidium cellare ATCC 36951]KAF2161757.1 hypothetical protein M409DRAFT_27813 [Zasmidium cellare ATCC 36951]
MFLTTGVLVLSRKISDKRAKDKQSKQQLLDQIRSIRPRSISNLPTIPSEEAGQPLTNTSSNATEPGRHSRDINVETPGNFTSSIRLQTEYASHPQRPSSDYGTSSELSPRGAPPPYSLTGASSSRTPSIAESSLLQPDSAISHGTFSDSNTLASSEYSTSTTTTAEDPFLRIRTKGTDLKSGFPYAPELFELRVRPELWEKFTAQIIGVTKFNNKDYAQMVGAATATALTGALLTSVYVGRSMNHSLREKKVKAGLENMSDGGLGDLLKQWNENEFKKLGIFVHLELSASAMKRANHRSPTMGKHPLMYSRREDRQRKTEERKFCLVVSRLDEEGVPVDAMEEIVQEAEEEQASHDKVVEAPNPAENVIYEVPELPGDEGRFPVELPAGVSLGYGSGKFELKCVELDGTPVTAVDRDFDPDRKEKIYDEEDDDAKLMPQPLMVTAETHAALHKEMT